MFKPFPMVRIHILLLKEDERTVLLSLGKQGILHLTRSEAGPGMAPFPPADVTPELDHCDKLLERCGELEQRLGPFGAPSRNRVNTDVVRPELTPLPALESAVTRLRSIEEQAARLFDDRQRLLAREKELDADCERVSSFRELEIPLDQLGQFSFLHFITGRLPEDHPQTDRARLAQLAPLLPLPDIAGRPSFLIITTPLNRQSLERQLQQMDFRQDSFPDGQGLTANTLYLERDGERQQLKRDLEQTDEALRRLALGTELQLKTSRQQISLERQLLEAKQHFACTGTAVLLAGWLPADTIRFVNEDLIELTKGRCVVEMHEPDGCAGEQVPVLLSHRGWLHPFQNMVTAFGLPDYAELEPTVLVAISYLAMFGMMFGDAGQGAVLVIAGLLLRSARRAASFRDAGRILLAGGLSSIIFGVLYGSYFGIPTLKRYALWRDPLEGDPLAILATAIGMGVMVISIGLILNIINRLRRKDLLDGVLGRFGLIGLLFYWGALALLIHRTEFQLHPPGRWATLVLIVLPLASWMLTPPIHEFLNRAKGVAASRDSLVVIFAESCASALEGVILYLANTVSFARLAAYAMSHAALLMAAFAVADELGRGSAGGKFPGLVVIILGNLIALILEGVIVAVQALRLEYYEFFGKFFSGQGHPYTPFNLISESTITNHRRR
ncbi:MAG: V-type ATPase 116kDa subunit family protein [bacterium]